MAEPLEDALRRDFTLNALFYNIGTACVEDFTGLGRKDLAAGLLRTPLDAAITLRDDPLRLLRGLRFQATYNFSLDDSFVAAAQQIEMCRQLEAKVSRERIGIEVIDFFGMSAPVVNAASAVSDSDVSPRYPDMCIWAISFASWFRCLAPMYRSERCFRLQGSRLQFELFVSSTLRVQFLVL